MRTFEGVTVEEHVACIRDCFEKSDWWAGVMGIPKWLCLIAIPMPFISYPAWGALMVVSIGLMVVGLWQSKRFHSAALTGLNYIPRAEALAILDERISRMSR